MNRLVQRAVAALWMAFLAACGPRGDTDAQTTDAASDIGVLVDSGIDVRADALDIAPADRAPIDDFVFNDLYDDADRDAGSGMQFGVLVGGTGTLPGAIAGLHYRVGAVDDVTDAFGRFHYTPGAMLTFQIADVAFRPTAGRAYLSPFQIAGTGSCEHSADLVKALVLLYSLDADGDPATGTALPAYGPAPATRSLADLSLADIATLVDQMIPGRATLTPDEATDRFIRQIDGEEWSDIGIDSFRLLNAVTRGQGLAADHTCVYFSSTGALERTDPTYHREAVNMGAIPAALGAQGSNHIGDIDVWNGSLYAPIEDGPDYANPLIVVFDAQTLAAGAVYPVPHTLQTEGVPWVAVNGPVGELYVAEWNPTPQINVFSLATVSYQRSVPLRPAVGRIQGAKVFDGALYLSSDDATKGIYKANLETGTVIHIFDVPIASENEGLAFFMSADGSQMHTLNVAADRLGSELRHHRRTRDPLRHAICP